MNILKGLVGPFKKVTLPKLREVVVMRGHYAYVCTDARCQAVMERAPKGRCERCNQTCIVSVQSLLRLAHEVKKARQQKPKTPNEESTRRAPENLAAFLTDFRAA